MSYTNSTKAPSTKGIRAAKELIGEILEGTEALQYALNLFSSAAAEHNIPIDQQAFLECCELMRTMNRLMNGEKGHMEHLLSNNKVAGRVDRSLKDIRRKHNMAPVAVAV